jgi:DNA-directed RNA polymerase subunit RPC12/RpoP
MQSFMCPQCGTESSYDPWAESARCPKCGYTPDPNVRPGKGTSQKLTGTHQPFLDELTAYWQGMHEPDLAFNVPTPAYAFAFFEEYQRSLGEEPHPTPKSHPRYVRNFKPERRDILRFVGAYLLLRRNDSGAAEAHLRALTEFAPEFADPWIWLTAVTPEPSRRIQYLENAVAQEPGHPLAKDALAIARGRVSTEPEQRAPGQESVEVKCPQCGGTLHHEPGAHQIECPYCGYVSELNQVNVIDADARLVSDLRLERRYRRRLWQELERTVNCSSCGSTLAMQSLLATTCPFCGSVTALDEREGHTFERPDALLPFKVTEQQAAVALDKAQRSGLGGLRALLLGQQEKLSGLQAIYFPYWVFDGFVEMRSWKAAGPKDDAPLSGTTPATETFIFDNLPFAGASTPDPGLQKQVADFDLGLLVPYEPQALADHPAALYDLDVDKVVRRAHAALLAKARRKARLQRATTAEEKRLLRRTFQVTSTTYQLVLVPIWVSLVQGNGKRRLGLVNGQTGTAALGTQFKAPPAA